MCPLIHRAVQAMGPGATHCRTTVPLLTELRSSQISHRAQVITDFSQSSGHHRFLTELRSSQISHRAQVITDFSQSSGHHRFLTELGSSQISHRAQVITDFSQSSGHHRFLTELRSSQISHRAQVITDFLLPTPQIWLRSVFGQRVAKDYPTPVDVYQLTCGLQQVWQSRLFRPSSSPRVIAA